MSKKMTLVWFLLIPSLYGIDPQNLNPTDSKISDTDVVGAYRVLAGKPISLDRFKELKKLIKGKRWELLDLGRYLINLEEVRSFLKIDFRPKGKGMAPSPLQNPIGLNEVSLESEAYRKLSTVNRAAKLLDEDITAIYRVLFGKPITIEQFSTLQRLRDVHHLDFRAFAIHVLSYDEVCKNLNLPPLSDVDTIPLLLKNGMTLFGPKSDVIITRAIATTGCWEPHLESLLRKLIKPGDYSIDVGANIGYTTAILSELVGEKGKVFSFEPFPALAKILKKSKSINNWRNVVLYPYAVTNYSGTVFMKTSTTIPGGTALISKEEAVSYTDYVSNNIAKVSCTSLDLLFNPYLKRLDHIKIDAEGAEPLVLAGAQKLIERFHPIITMEFTPREYRKQGIDPVQILNNLKKQGYRFAFVIDLWPVNDVFSFVKVKSLEPGEIVKRIDAIGTYLDLLAVHLPV
jgi:FkbM family methyltransferase